MFDDYFGKNEYKTRSGLGRQSRGGEYDFGISSAPRQKWHLSSKVYAWGFGAFFLQIRRFTMELLGYILQLIQ